MSPTGECHIIETTELTWLIGLTRANSCRVDATPEALKACTAMTVPGLFLIMKSDGCLIHMGWAVGRAGFARVNLSPDGDGAGRLI